MLIALRLTICLLRAGQMSTQTPQPVQSSGATWMVNAQPARGPSLRFQGWCWKPLGASLIRSGG